MRQQSVQGGKKGGGRAKVRNASRKGKEWHLRPLGPGDRRSVGDRRPGELALPTHAHAFTSRPRAYACSRLGGARPARTLGERMPGAGAARTRGALARSHCISAHCILRAPAWAWACGGGMFRRHAWSQCIILLHASAMHHSPTRLLASLLLCWPPPPLLC